MKTHKFIFGGLSRVLALVGVLMSSLTWAADELVVYSGRSDKFVQPVVEKFTEQSGIKVVLHSGESTALLNKMQVEGARTQADLFISNDAGNLQKGSDLGLFSVMPSNLASEVPENLRSPNNEWLGLSARARVLVMSSKAKDLDWVKSVFDLADPRLKGRLGITNSANESYIAGVTVYMEAIGKEKVKAWLEGLKSNVEGSVFNKHSKIVKAVADGKLDVGLVNHYYIYRHLESDPSAAVKIVLPDQGKNGMGVAWNVAGIAINKHSRKQAAAQQFVKFLVSESGQKIFAEMNSEYPVRPGVAAADEVPAAGSYKVANVPMLELGRKRDETIDLIEAVGMP